MYVTDLSKGEASLQCKDEMEILGLLAFCLCQNYDNLNREFCARKLQASIAMLHMAAMALGRKRISRLACVP
ncbi:Uncharacterised protein [Burkholderia pseudomallei]|nr:Uncharacterised protein [Burkholderia pseudomallei]